MSFSTWLFHNNQVYILSKIKINGSIIPTRYSPPLNQYLSLQHHIGDRSFGVINPKYRLASSWCNDIIKLLSQISVLKHNNSIKQIDVLSMIAVGCGN